MKWDIHCIRLLQLGLGQGWYNLLYLLYILYRRKNLLYSYIGGLKHSNAPIFYILVVHAVLVAEAKYFNGGLKFVHVIAFSISVFFTNIMNNWFKFWKTCLEILCIYEDRDCQYILGWPNPSWKLGQTLPAGHC